MTIRIEGPAPELEIARDLTRRGAMVLPLFIVAGGLAQGLGGSASAGFAVVLVACNFLFSAWIIATAARISLAALYGAVMGGYVLRLVLVTVAFFAVRTFGWFEAESFAFTLLATHLGLLFWETQYVSATLAHPGLKPEPRS